MRTPIIYHEQSTKSNMTRQDQIFYSLDWLQCYDTTKSQVICWTIGSYKDMTPIVNKFDIIEDTGH